jgi:hypothetical protein
VWLHHEELAHRFGSDPLLLKFTVEHQKMIVYFLALLASAFVVGIAFLRKSADQPKPARQGQAQLRASSDSTVLLDSLSLSHKSQVSVCLPAGVYGYYKANICFQYVSEHTFVYTSFPRTWQQCPQKHPSIASRRSSTAARSSSTTVRE